MSDRTMCLVIVALIFSPRIVMILWWLLDTARWAATFDGPLLPILGFVLAPWTTLMYVLVAPGGLTGLDWLWMAVAVVVDLGAIGGGASRRRE
ncbi:MAG TPA: hypothetical protein VFM03_05230 [Candidatus Limnocylindria bacterium]|nr:hypothetical protein [Candidatus Limnocylindria bacterium]